MVNKQKSNLEPNQDMVYLSMKINTNPSARLAASPPVAVTVRSPGLNRAPVSQVKWCHNDISLILLKNALKGMENGKAPGLDEIPVELLNHMAVGVNEPAMEWRSRVKANTENEDWFEIQSGVRQSSNLSTQSILFMDKCMRQENPDENITTDLIYADDHAVVAETIEDLQQKMTDWNNILTSKGMEISKEKTEIMLLSRTPADITVSLEG
ncbi:uncharacterized protein [Palaemon carinicauda]|uniref:uncharacterized protein n=1 Tax=Palaemon carinicauda TaxID=392227 RepID=UPI0035B59527